MSLRENGLHHRNNICFMSEVIQSKHALQLLKNDDCGRPAHKSNDCSVREEVHQYPEPTITNPNDKKKIGRLNYRSGIFIDRNA